MSTGTKSIGTSHTNTLSERPKTFAGFSHLPVELGSLICKHAIMQTQPIDLSKRINQSLPEITGVSKFFHTEGSTLYYRHNTFLVPLPSRLTPNEAHDLDTWLRSDTTTQTCTKIKEIIVQISLPPDRPSLANLLQLALHFHRTSNVKARGVLGLQPLITVPVEQRAITLAFRVDPDLEKQVSDAFWHMYDGSLHDLSQGTYQIEWVDEEEMEMCNGVPLLEQSVAMGQICEELWLAIMRVWYPHDT